MSGPKNDDSEADFQAILVCAIGLREAFWKWHRHLERGHPKIARQIIDCPHFRLIYDQELQLRYFLYKQFDAENGTELERYTEEHVDHAKTLDILGRLTGGSAALSDEFMSRVYEEEGNGLGGGDSG